MANLETLKAAVDDLKPDELNELYNHIVQRRQPSYWLVPSEKLSQILEIMQPAEASSEMTEQEINDLIDESLAEVRSERKDQTHRGH